MNLVFGEWVDLPHHLRGGNLSDGSDRDQACEMHDECV
jgi:hypothetical protein